PTYPSVQRREARLRFRGASRNRKRASLRVTRGGRFDDRERRPASRPVSRVLSRRLAPAATVIYLGAELPRRSSGLPGSRNGPDQPCSLIWPCSRWGLPSQPVTRLLVGSYIKGPRPPHLFTLTCVVSGEG